MFVAFPLIISLIVGVATWILAVPTIGRELAPNNPQLIGFAIGLLASTSVFCLSILASRRPAVPHVCLVICGTICVILPLGMQFYLASMSAENARQILDALRAQAATNPTGNINVSSNTPHSFGAISYLTQFFGIWLGAVGVCSAMTSRATEARSLPIIARSREATVTGI